MSSYVGNQSLSVAQASPKFLVQHALVKAQQRKFVLDFMLANSRMEMLRCFTLPGIGWEFERMLAAKWRKPLRIISIERESHVFQAGHISMPGTDRRYATIRHAGDEIPAYSTTQACVLNINAGVFMNPVTALTTNSQRRHWESHYCRWNAAWMDFCTPVNPELLSCLKALPRHIHPGCRYFPFSVTVAVGRERASASELIRAAAKRSSSPTEQRAIAIARYFNKHSRSHEMVVEDFQRFQTIVPGIKQGQAMVVVNTVICPR